ncbi:NADH dehydrogenase subunit 5 [Listeria innocua FSL S4-378]|nr:NADH dehydrogenase subunit 5 [Listeria innocua FSL S4-378]
MISPVASTVTSSFTKETSAFKYLSTSLIVNTSDKFGTFFNTLVPLLASNVAAITGNTAFLAPSIFTEPFNCFPPRTIIFSKKNPSALLITKSFIEFY